MSDYNYDCNHNYSSGWKQFHRQSCALLWSRGNISNHPLLTDIQDVPACRGGRLKLSEVPRFGTLSPCLSVLLCRWCYFVPKLRLASSLRLTSFAWDLHVPLSLKTYLFHWLASFTSDLPPSFSTYLFQVAYLPSLSTWTDLLGMCLITALPVTRGLYGFESPLKWT